MREKLISYIEYLFKDAPQSADQLKAQTLEGALSKYDELVCAGVGEDEAFNTVLSHLGDVRAQYSRAGDKHSKDEVKKRSLMLSVAVALYILSLIPPILLDRVNEDLGACLMFLMIAVATAMIIYRATAYKNDEASTAQPAKKKATERKEASTAVIVRRVLCGVIWAVGAVVWLLLTIFTGAWHITWLVFLICLALNNALSAAFDLRK